MLIQKIKEPIKEIRRTLCEYIGVAKYSHPALNNLDIKLEKYLKYKNGFFIEAGANDGFAQSNTYYFEKLRGWHGILIEPIPELFEKCRKLRKNSVVLNCALVSEEFNDTKIKLKFANLMSIVEGALGDEDKETEHLKSGLQCQNIDETYTFEAPARTITSILDERKVTEIDFFSLDVEGYELEVLKGLDFNKYRPKYLCIETRQKKNIEEYIKPYYEMIEAFTELDILYRVRK